MHKSAFSLRHALFAAVTFSTLTLETPASAAPVVFGVGADYSSAPFTFSFGDSSFTFSSTSDFFQPTAVQTGGTGLINTVFGSPTTNFVDRGTVTFGPSDQYGAFATTTPIRFSNGRNFIGLAATRGTDTFFGYAFTTDNLLNGYSFESSPNTSITGVTAVPEAATWAMMLGGFGLVGGVLRRRRRQASVTVRYA